MDKLDIKNEMRAFDLKDRDYYVTMTDEEKRKFSPFLMIRWGSCVSGSTELQEFYIVATNLRLNVNFFNCNKHPELQWLMATSVSPGLGAQRHNWIGMKKRESSGNKTVKFLSNLYPTMKLDDVELLASLMSKKELKTLAEEHGMTPEQIKKELWLNWLPQLN